MNGYKLTIAIVSILLAITMGMLFQLKYKQAKLESGQADIVLFLDAATNKQYQTLLNQIKSQ